MGLHLEPGQLGLIVGQTGSGKTAGAVSMIEHSPITPKIILDTKGEDKFDRFLTGDNLEITNIREYRKLKYNKLPEYTILRPNRFELHDSVFLDLYADKTYLFGNRLLFFADEIYQLHNNGRAGPGLLGILTRGRSKEITFLGGCQRPTWITRFCLTETQKFYIYRLMDSRDRKNLGEVIYGFSRLSPAAKYHFYYHDANTGDTIYYSPFDYHDTPIRKMRKIL